MGSLLFNFLISKQSSLNLGSNAITTLLVCDNAFIGMRQRPYRYAIKPLTECDNALIDMRQRLYQNVTKNLEIIYLAAFKLNLPL